MNRIDISIMDLKNSNQICFNEKYKDVFQLEMSADQCIQHRNKDNIVVMSNKGKAVFDLNGNLLELFDLRKNPGLNIVNQSGSKDLEFEMVLLFSKFNI